jgi:hypothetical protein
MKREKSAKALSNGNGMANGNGVRHLDQVPNLT